jgi:hypothetical protein
MANAQHRQMIAVMNKYLEYFKDDPVFFEMTDMRCDRFIEYANGKIEWHHDCPHWDWNKSAPKHDNIVLPVKRQEPSGKLFVERDLKYYILEHDIACMRIEITAKKLVLLKEAGLLPAPEEEAEDDET